MTAKILKTLEPIRLPKEIAFSFLIIATIEADNSGILVPIEIIETLITRSLTSIKVAKETAPFTKVSDPSHSEKPPANRYIKVCFLFNTLNSAEAGSINSFCPFLFNK